MSKWDPVQWLELAVLRQARAPLVKVELDRQQALDLLKYIKDLQESLEALKAQQGGLSPMAEMR